MLPISQPTHHRSPDVARCVELSIQVVTRLSRSFQGEANTDVSALKAPLVLSGDALAAAVRLNLQSAVDAILEYGPNDIRCTTDAETLLYETAARVNHGLLEPKRPLMRTWETGIPTHSPAAAVVENFQRFAEEFHDRWRGSFVDAVQFASWVEWRSNAHGHFLTDGCGRFARAFSIAALGRQRVVYPAFRDRSEYYTHIETSCEHWQQAYSDRIGRGS